MLLTKKDIEKIQSILEKFPDIDQVELEQDSSSGIGSITLMTLFTEVNGTKGSFTVEIAGVEDW